MQAQPQQDLQQVWLQAGHAGSKRSSRVVDTQEGPQAAIGQACRRCQRAQLTAAVYHTAKHTVNRRVPEPLVVQFSGQINLCVANMLQTHQESSPLRQSNKPVEKDSLMVRCERYATNLVISEERI